MKRTIIFFGNFCVKISSLCAFYSTFQWIKKKTNTKHWETTFFFLERIFNLKNEKILLYFFLNMFFQIFYSFSYSNKNQYYCTFLLCFQSEMLALRKKKPNICLYMYNNRPQWVRNGKNSFDDWFNITSMVLKFFFFGFQMKNLKKDIDLSLCGILLFSFYFFAHCVDQ